MNAIQQNHANKNVKTLLEVTHAHVEMVSLKTQKMQQSVPVYIP